MREARRVPPLIEAYPEPALHAGRPARPPAGALHWRFFDCMVDPDSGRYLSEDYAFCRLWRDIGGKVLVDLECKLNHLGQHMYRGDLAGGLAGAGVLVGREQA